MTYDLRSVYGQACTILACHPRIKLADLCHQIGVDRHTIEAAVHAATGKSFRQFQQQALLNYITSSFDAEPNLTLKEVASRLGYQSPHTFGRFVKRVSGMTPTELRRTASNS